MTFATPAQAARARATTSARAELLLPLVGAYLLLASVYAWQAWRRETPTIFTDELELTQLSRSIAETGLPGRRGDSYGFSTLVPWLTAPFWWLDSVSTAYETIKLVQAFVMTTAIFPAYLLARRVVSPGWAFFAAVGAVVAPALSYAPILVEEPWAYPAATLALWLAVRAVDRPTRGAVALAIGSTALAVLVRSQLVALFGALALAFLALGWRSGPMRRWRTTWSAWDTAGAAALALGALLAGAAVLGHVSAEWERVMSLWKGRLLEYGAWAGGAFAIGIGILPAIALLAVVALPASERRRPGVRAFVAVTGGAVVSLGWYAALKGAYLSTEFSSLIVERNLVYLGPLAFVATAILLQRAAAPVWAMVVSGAAVLCLVVSVPIERGLDNFPYYESHGLAILALANREWAWPLERIELALIAMVVLATAGLLVAATSAGSRLLVPGLPVALAVVVLGWNLTAEVYAAIGEHDLSARVEANLPKPNDWVDRAVGDGSVVFLGQRLSDNAGPNLTEFWNRSIEQVWSVDGTGPPPGHTLTPDLVDVDGTLFPDPETDFVLAANGVDVVGEQVASNPAAAAVVVRLDGPIRLRANTTDIATDGWIVGDPDDPTASARAAYNRFDLSGGGVGTALVTLSRETFCPAGVRLPGAARVRIGVLARGADKQPSIGRVTAEETTYVPACAVRPVTLPTPNVPWRIEVVIETFVPARVDPAGSGGERRALGARASFAVLPS